jgi:hypothetical protein
MTQIGLMHPSLLPLAPRPDQTLDSPLRLRLRPPDAQVKTQFGRTISLIYLESVPLKIEILDNVSNRLSLLSQIIPYPPILHSKLWSIIEQTGSGPSMIEPFEEVLRDLV